MDLRPKPQPISAMDGDDLRFPYVLKANGAPMSLIGYVLSGAVHRIGSSDPEQPIIFEQTDDAHGAGFVTWPKVAPGSYSWWTKWVDPTGAEKTFGRGSFVRTVRTV